LHAHPPPWRCVRGIQNPFLRHPPKTAGSQKRHDTAQVEVFSCARSPSVTEKMTSSAQFFPDQLAPRLTGGKRRFIPNRAMCSTCKYRPCQGCDSCLVLSSLMYAPARARLSPLSVGGQRLGDDSTSWGKLYRFFQLTWLGKSVTFPLMVTATRR